MSEDNEFATDNDAADATDAAETPTINTPPSVNDGGEGSLARELADQQDKYLRLAAEYDNYRRRTVKERQDAHLHGQAEMLRGLIDPLDDIGRFAHVDPATTDSKVIVDGVAMVEKKLLKTLAGHGLEVIDPVDHPFNPALHEAVMTEPAATKEEDHLVARVFQLGYVFNGQLIRPARVVVKQWNG